MDALTQLLESYVSIRANPLTDALALKGIAAVSDGLMDWYAGGDDAAAGRAQMALAALFSGICLAQAGLGSVHGLAQPLGSFFPIPHGVVCGTLLAAAVRVNVEAMESRAPAHPALGRYAEVARLLGADPRIDDAAARAWLIAELDDWTRRLALPPLAELGVAQGDLARIVANSRGSSMKTNPIELDDAEVERILQLRLGE
jgi:alcohol dehydrogenase